MLVRNKSAGFTLVELVVVMAIMATLTALAVPSMMEEYNQKRANTSIAESQMILDAAHSYRIKNGSWPGGTTCANALTTLSDPANPFMGKVQPINRYGSAYSTSCTAQTFSLDQTVIEDWDGYIANELAGTEQLTTSAYAIRSTIGVPGSESALDGKLSRIATGNAELNRMRTALLLGDNDINEVGTINARNGVFSESVNVNGQIDSLRAVVANSLTAKGTSQFDGEAKFTQQAKFAQGVSIDRVVTDGAAGCTAGSVARNAAGVPLTCQAGVWVRSANWWNGVATSGAACAALGRGTLAMDSAGNLYICK